MTKEQQAQMVIKAYPFALQLLMCFPGWPANIWRLSLRLTLQQLWHCHPLFGANAAVYRLKISANAFKQTKISKHSHWSIRTTILTYRIDCFTRWR